MEGLQEKDFKTIINEVKKQISNTQIEIFQNANMSLLKLYYSIGKIIYDNSKWGNKFINEMALELKISFPNVKGFSIRNLKSMKKYYLICSQNKKVQTASAQIPWSHNMLILDKISVDYALKSINKPIGVSSYEIREYLPSEIIKELPTEDDLNLHIDIKK